MNSCWIGSISSIILESGSSVSGEEDGGEGEGGVKRPRGKGNSLGTGRASRQGAEQ